MMGSSEIMTLLTNKEFITFINSFKENSEYYTTVSEISKPIYKEDGVEKKGNPLIPSVDFKMFSLDDIKHDTQSFKNNFPKSTDALYYKLKEDELTIYLIEFKGHNLNNPNKKSKITALKRTFNDRKEKCSKKTDGSKCYTSKMIYDIELVEKEYGDTIEFGLKEKPTDTIFLTIPMIYKEYCKKNNYEIKDIEGFLRKCKKRLFIFAAEYDENTEDKYELIPSESKKVEKKSMRVTIQQNNKKSRRNTSNINKSNGKYNKSKIYVRTMGMNLNQHYDKLKKAGIVDYYKIKNKHQFQSFLRQEHLKELDNT